MGQTGMIGKEDIRQGLRLRGPCEGMVASITLTDDASDDKLKVTVPMAPFDFVVTDVYPRMGEVVVMGVSGNGASAQGVFPVRLTVERFLRFFGGYAIVEAGVADRADDRAEVFSVDAFRKEADNCERLGKMSSENEYERILANLAQNDPYNYGACCVSFTTVV